MKKMLFIALLLSPLLLQAQSLTLQECYTLAERNYPLVKQRNLIASTKEYSIQNLSKGYLPQFSINGQATYQSEVTQIPIQLPGMDIPSLSKDQYKLYGELNQTIFDGGVIKQQKESQESNARVEEQKISVELYKLKERINQLYFGVLLVNEQIKQTDLLKKDIQLGIKKTEGAIANGAAFKSSLDILKAESLKTDQRVIELNALRIAYLNMLGVFINRELNDSTVLEKPNALTLTSEISRPEVQLYDYQNRAIDTQDKMLSARNRPKLNLFVQGGYGRPALNMLSNDFESYYLGGVRLNWSLSGLYTLKRERSLLDISRQSIQIQKETFLFNTNVTIKQQQTEVNKFSSLLSTDAEIVALRANVKNVSAVQLENGVINTSDYLREVNAEDQARQNQVMHEIQYLMAQYAQQTTSGGTL